MKMALYTQTDPRFAKEIMTQKKGAWTDYLEDWGCLVTSLSNIFTIHSGRDFTPQATNKMVVDHDGYWYLSGRTKQEENASFLDFDVIRSIFLCELKYTDFTSGEYYIIKIKSKMRYKGKLIPINHFINLINYFPKTKKFLAFDVYDGKCKFYNEKEILAFLRVRIQSG